MGKVRRLSLHDVSWEGCQCALQHTSTIEIFNNIEGTGRQNQKWNELQETASSPLFSCQKGNVQNRKIKQASGHGKLIPSKHRAYLVCSSRPEAKVQGGYTLEANLAVWSLFPEACLPGSKTQEGQNDSDLGTDKISHDPGGQDSASLKGRM